MQVVFYLLRKARMGVNRVSHALPAGYSSCQINHILCSVSEFSHPVYSARFPSYIYTRIAESYVDLNLYSVIYILQYILSVDVLCYGQYEHFFITSVTYMTSKAVAVLEHHWWEVLAKTQVMESGDLTHKAILCYTTIFQK